MSNVDRVAALVLYERVNLNEFMWSIGVCEEVAEEMLRAAERERGEAPFVAVRGLSIPTQTTTGGTG